ncbi:transketolase [Lawsonibacter sp. OA9]|uniref:transketolase n=1 Tax=Oscillospiraceae TaxID=216572 RepID=UPI001F052C80|nr:MULTISPECIES: transketolase [Oscillospiraceae]MCH1980893.1 transketolase [Lawsonibacter sp. OA9]MCH1982369.1 transketolase [Ruminococcus sp. OA3]
MDAELKKSLQKFATEIRIGTVESIKSRGFGHIGGALSVCDALAVLYGSQMTVDPKNPKMPERDKLVCSKGHAGPAIYATLALKGFYPYEEIKTLNQPGTNFPSHCDCKKTPGIDITTGSLGQGTSLADGIALADKLKGRDSRTFLIVGDGEINEGQCWEAFMFAAAKKLSNLVVLVDNNKKQLDGYVADVLPTGDLGAKMAAFGFETVTVNGNDVEALYDALENTKKGGDKPYAIVMDTVKGAGVKEIEETMGNHSMAVGADKFDEWLSELNEKLAAMA